MKKIDINIPNPFSSLRVQNSENEFSNPTKLSKQKQILLIIFIVFAVLLFAILIRKLYPLLTASTNIISGGFFASAPFSKQDSQSELAQSQPAPTPFEFQ